MKLGAFVVCGLLLGCANGQNPGKTLTLMLEEIRARNDVPALGGAIVESDFVEIVTVGVRKRGTSAKVTDNDHWHLGSDTKAMTATLIAMLVEEKKLKWYDTIGERFPELRNEMNAAYRDVTLQQLLCHRGGF